MRFSDYVRSAQSNLLRSKLRTLLTILALFIGAFTLTLTTALGEGIRQYGDQQLRAQAQPDTAMIFARSASDENPFGSSKKVAEYDPTKGSASTDRSTLTQSDLDTIMALPNITGAWFGRSIVTEYVQHGDGKKYVAALEPLYPMTQLDLAAGALPGADDMTAYVLPYQYLEAFGFAQPSDAIGKTITVHFVEQTVPIEKPGTPPVAPKTMNREFTIRAVLVNSAITQNAYASFRVIDEISAFQFGDSQAPSLIIAGTTPGMTKAQSAELQKMLNDKNYNAFMYQDAIASFTKAISIIQLGLGGFSGIALLAAMIGIVNTLMMAAFERTQEIGLWKALGMRRRGIFGLFVYEAASIGIWGGLIGMFLAFGVGTAANAVLARTLLKDLEGFTLLSFRWEYMTGVVVLAMVIGLLAGVLPAVRASKLDPIDALRSE